MHLQVDAAYIQEAPPQWDEAGVGGWVRREVLEKVKIKAKQDLVDLESELMTVILSMEAESNQSSASPSSSQRAESMEATTKFMFLPLPVETPAILDTAQLMTQFLLHELLILEYELSILGLSFKFHASDSMVIHAVDSMTQKTESARRKNEILMTTVHSGLYEQVSELTCVQKILMECGSSFQECQQLHRNWTAAFEEVKQARESKMLAAGQGQTLQIRQLLVEQLIDCSGELEWCTKELVLSFDQELTKCRVGWSEFYEQHLILQQQVGELAQRLQERDRLEVQLKASQSLSSALAKEYASMQLKNQILTASLQTVQTVHVSEQLERRWALALRHVPYKLAGDVLALLRAWRQLKVRTKAVNNAVSFGTKFCNVEHIVCALRYWNVHAQQMKRVNSVMLLAKNRATFTALSVIIVAWRRAAHQELEVKRKNLTQRVQSEWEIARATDEEGRARSDAHVLCNGVFWQARLKDICGQLTLLIPNVNALFSHFLEFESKSGETLPQDISTMKSQSSLQNFLDFEHSLVLKKVKDIDKMDTQCGLSLEDVLKIKEHAESDFWTPQTEKDAESSDLRIARSKEEKCDYAGDLDWFGTCLDQQIKQIEDKVANVGIELNDFARLWQKDTLPVGESDPMMSKSRGVHLEASRVESETSFQSHQSTSSEWVEHQQEIRKNMCIDRLGVETQFKERLILELRDEIQRLHAQHNEIQEVSNAQLLVREKNEFQGRHALDTLVSTLASVEDLLHAAVSRAAVHLYLQNFHEITHTRFMIREHRHFVKHLINRRLVKHFWTCWFVAQILNVKTKHRAQTTFLRLKKVLTREYFERFKMWHRQTQKLCSLLHIYQDRQQVKMTISAWKQWIMQLPAQMGAKRCPGVGSGDAAQCRMETTVAPSLA
jgi:hypothetical protein